MDPLLSGALAFFMLATFVYIKFVREPSKSWKKEHLIAEQGQEYALQHIYGHDIPQHHMRRRNNTATPPEIVVQVEGQEQGHQYANNGAFRPSGFYHQIPGQQSSWQQRPIHPPEYSLGPCSPPVLKESIHEPSPGPLVDRDSSHSPEQQVPATQFHRIHSHEPLQAAPSPFNQPHAMPVPFMLYGWNQSSNSKREPPSKGKSEEGVSRRAEEPNCLSNVSADSTVATQKPNAHGRRSSLWLNPHKGPAQMQIRVAQQARIPLFIKSPLFEKTSPTKEETAKSFRDAVKMLDGATDAPNREEEMPVAGMIAQPVEAVPVGHGPSQNTREPPRSVSRVGGKLAQKDSNLNINFHDIRLGKLIGQGAFGTVHEATWRGTAVAVKMLLCQNLTPDVLEEFYSEVQIMSILRHPNICLLMGACLDPPTRCLVVELVSKGSLWSLLRRPLDLNMSTQLQFVGDTARGMNYLHTFDPPILHRDLKSPNLLVDHGYHIKLSDFGLSRVKAQCQTMTGNCGTVQWMAPEILGAEKYTEKADVFSFGIVVWEIVARACPYDGLSQIQAALGVLKNNLRPTIPSNCPPLFKRLMRACWATNPDQRPTFEQILVQLNSNHIDRSADPSM